MTDLEVTLAILGKAGSLAHARHRAAKKITASK